MNIKNGLSSADLTAIYKDLKVKAVNKKSLNIESPLETFISNNFVLKESNPENGKEDKGTFYYSKKNDDAFLDIIWLSVKGALGSIVGYAM